MNFLAFFSGLFSLVPKHKEFRLFLSVSASLFILVFLCGLINYSFTCLSLITSYHNCINSCQKLIDGQEKFSGIFSVNMKVQLAIRNLIFQNGPTLKSKKTFSYPDTYKQPN